MEEGDKINDEFIVGREEQAQKTAGSLTKLFEEERKKEEEEEEGKGDKAYVHDGDGAQEEMHAENKIVQLSTIKENVMQMSSAVVSDDIVLDEMLRHERLKDMFEKIIYQPKESDLVESLVLCFFHEKNWQTR